MRKRKALVTFVTLFAFILSFQTALAEETSAKVTRSIEGSVRYKDVKTLKFSQSGDVTVDILETLEIVITPEPTSTPIVTPTATPKVKDKEIVIVMDTSKAVTGPIERGSDPFDYALFAGSDKESDNLLLTGNKFILDGDCHSNSGVIVGVGKAESDLKGKLNYLGNIQIYDSTLEVDSKRAEQKIDMPNLVNNFNTVNAIRFSYNALSPITGDRLYKDLLKTGSDNELKDVYGDRLKVSYDPYTEKWDINGDTIKLDENRPYFFEGKVTISVNHILGNGVIVATDDIMVNPGTSSEGDVGIYSAYGNITLNLASGSLFKGLLYAPGTDDEDGERTGVITIRSDNFEFHGSIVGKSLDLSGNKNIKYVVTEVHDDFTDPEEENYLLDRTKDKVIEIVNSLGGYSGSNVKVATIIYSDYAEIVNSSFSVISSPEASEDVANARTRLIDRIRSIEDREGCNLGDGLRLAYHLFETAGDEDAQKYLIVFSNNVLDKYTVIEGTNNFRTSNGQLSESDVAGSVKTNSVKAYEYAEEIAGMIAEKDYTGVYFVDVRMDNDDVIKLSNIGEKANAKRVGDLYCYNPEANAGRTFLNELDSAVSEIKDELVIREVEELPIPEPTATPVPTPIPTPTVIVTTNPIEYTVGVEFGIRQPDGSITYTNKLPEGVEFVSSDSLILTANGLQFVSGFDSRLVKREIEDGTKLSVKIPDLEVRVRFNRIGTFNFELAKLVYVFTRVDRDDVEPIRIPVDIEPLRIEVLSPVDIN